MSILTEQVLFCRDGGEVKRFHARRMLQEQKNSDHSFGVAYLVALIMGPKQVSSALMVHAIFHDLAEQATGDVPAPVKRRLHLRGIFSAEERRIVDEKKLDLPPLEDGSDECVILKVADSLEGMLTCLRELQFGNAQLSETFENFASYTSGILPTSTSSPYFLRAWEIYHWIQHEWELAGGGN